MAKLSRRYSKVERTERSEHWSVNPGDIALIERANGSYIFGIIESVDEDGRSYAFRHPALRLNYHVMGGELFPTLDVATSREGNNRRSASAIRDITIGKEAIAQRIRSVSFWNFEMPASQSDARKSIGLVLNEYACQIERMDIER